MGALHSVAVRGRAGALPAFPRGCRNRPCRPPRRAALVRHALDVRDGARVAHPQRPHRLRDGEVHGGDDHDADRVSRVCAGAADRRTLRRAVRRHSLVCDPRARVLVDDRRGAARISLFDALSLPDPAHARAAVALVDRRNDRGCDRRAVRPRRARRRLGRAGVLAAVHGVALGTGRALALDVDGLGLGRLPRPAVRHRRDRQRRARQGVVRVVHLDGSLQAPHLRPRSERGGRAHDRPRCLPSRRGARRSLARPGRAADADAHRVPQRPPCCGDLVRRLHGGEVDVRVDDVRHLHVRTQPHLPGTAPLRRDGGLARAADPASGRRLRSGGVRALPAADDAVRDGAGHLVQRPRPRDPAAGQPVPEARSDRREDRTGLTARLLGDPHAGSPRWESRSRRA